RDLLGAESGGGEWKNPGEKHRRPEDREADHAGPDQPSEGPGIPREGSGCESLVIHVSVRHAVLRRGWSIGCCSRDAFVLIAKTLCLKLQGSLESDKGQRAVLAGERQSRYAETVRIRNRRAHEEVDRHANRF